MAPTSLTKTPQVRIGDAERQAAARDLQQHYADGRITWQELDERLAHVYAARVAGELDGPFADLPPLPPPPSPPVPLRSRVQHATDRLREADVRRLVMLTLIAAVAIGLTHGIVLIPAFFAWFFFADRRRGRGRWNGDHRRHGSGHGRACG